MCRSTATLEVTEDRALVEENSDWQRCLVALIYITEEYLTHTGNMGWRLNDLQGFFIRFQYVRGFLDLRGEERADGAPAPSRMREGVRFEGVSFVYPGSDAPALSGIDRVSTFVRESELLLLGRTARARALWQNS